jgi:hypothetical protein
MKRRVFPLVFSSVVVGLACACGSSNGNGQTIVDGGMAGDGAAGDGAASSPLGFTPSNIDLSGLDLSKAGDLDLSGDFCLVETERTDGPQIGCTNASKDVNYVVKQMAMADGSQIAVFVAHAIHVEPNTVLRLDGGHIPLALVALDTITLGGSISVLPGLGGGAFNAVADMPGAGPGGGGGGSGTSTLGGGGGSFCGLGGQGGVEQGSAATPYPQTAAYGTAELVPLVAGSAGGKGVGGFGVGATSASHGGGAVQLVAGTSIQIAAGAFVSAPGSGGQQGGLAATQEAAGGGSGGAILIEAPTVTVAGVLATNGGGGGGGAGGTAAGGQSGEPGHDSDANPASGGSGGGAGGAGDQAAGGNATAGVSFTAPGGGGGAGRIRINTATGSADVASGVVTPSATSGCFTQGTLKP